MKDPCEELTNAANDNWKQSRVDTLTASHWASLDDDDGLLLTVTDTGVGISAEDLPKVMLPFVQVDSGLDRKHEGIGLGDRFLGHVERCAVLLHLVDGTEEDPAT